MGSQRTIITLSNEEKSWLENYSKSCKISLAEAIRRGITRLRDEEAGPTYQKAVKQTRGIWQNGDGLEYLEKLRAEWR